MKTTAVVIATVLAAGLLSACSATPDAPESAPALTSEVEADSSPAFLEVAATATDVVPDGVDTAGVDPASVRYQSLWNGKAVYLGVDAEGDVTAVYGVPGSPDTWETAAAEGNDVFTIEDDKSVLTYVPQGTDDLPDGYYAFSPWIALN